MNNPQAIDFTRIYSTGETKELCHGVKFSRLRKAGMRSVGNGYLVAHIFQALLNLGAPNSSCYDFKSTLLSSQTGGGNNANQNQIAMGDPHQDRRSQRRKTAMENPLDDFKRKKAALLNLGTEPA